MSYNFTNTDAIKRMLGISSGLCAGTTMYDEAIADIQLAVEVIVQDELGLEYAGVTTYSERYDINFIGQNEIATRFRPVVNVVALTIGGQLQTAVSSADTGGEYAITKDLGVIKLNPLYMSFPTGRGIIEITYTAGLDPMPADIKYAANLIACSLFNQQGHVGFVSERASGYSYNMGSGIGSTIPQIAQRILSKHRRLMPRGSYYDTNT